MKKLLFLKALFAFFTISIIEHIMGMQEQQQSQVSFRSTRKRVAERAIGDDYSWERLSFPPSSASGIEDSKEKAEHIEKVVKKEQADILASFPFPVWTHITDALGVYIPLFHASREIHKQYWLGIKDHFRRRTSIALSPSFFHKERIGHLLKYISRCKKLRNVDLSHIFVDRKDANEIVYALRKCPDLRSLDIQFPFNIGDDETIKAYLKKYCPHFQLLALRPITGGMPVVHLLEP